jgi:hypothetical protein
MKISLIATAFFWTLTVLHADVVTIVEGDDPPVCWSTLTLTETVPFLAHNEKIRWGPKLAPLVLTANLRLTLYPVTFVAGLERCQGSWTRRASHRFCRRGGEWPLERHR